MKEVSLVITSCGRFDLLERTLDSFFEKNTYPIKKVIITEDSTEGNKLKKLVSKYKNQNFDLIINETRLGQLKCIDKAYKKVDTEYVFHCEDDWLFLKEGFIEKSLEVIEDNPKIAIVGLRPREDCTEIPLCDEPYFSKSGVEFFEIRDHVFTYNPGLRRKDVCDLFGSHEKLEGTLWEDELCKFYKERGYRMVSFAERYVEHIGNKRHVHFSKRGKNSVLDFKIDRMIKKIRYNLLKMFGKIK
ncbi:glycosyltransferase [Pseudoleptotrichia goodfellowii]|uniref:Family 2 glycosyl transferase n=1 Tax=Pseudoleptotrichia goodfellowii TaxID=157692 RepID=A0A510JDH1_9FUSO|nr:glycosyltransferase [Pseudoleptotrichia goodfellowii]BBM37274.1 family 2 glycosyl transferase [Pseudoleptotrichia goodfellowii]